MSKLVAVDNGSTAIKFCWKDDNGNFKTGVFKSRYVDNLLMGADDYVLTAYSMPEGSVTIDEKASNPIKTDTAKYQYSHYVRAGVYEALRRTGIKEEIDLVVTLPISQFYMMGNQGGLNKDNIESVKKNLMAEINSAREDVTLPKVRSVRVYPEGVGALPGITTDKEGYLRDEFDIDDKVLIIDIGGSTVDIALVADLNGTLQSKLSLTNGVLTIIEDLRSLAQPKLKSGTMITREFAEKVFCGKQVLGQDFSKEVAEASKNFVSSIMREIESMLTDPMLRHVVVCGGGANLVGGALKSQIESEGSGATVSIPKDPETTLACSIFKREEAHIEAVPEVV